MFKAIWNFIRILFFSAVAFGAAAAIWFTFSAIGAAIRAAIYHFRG